VRSENQVATIIQIHYSFGKDDEDEFYIPDSPTIAYDMIDFCYEYSIHNLF